MVMDKKEQKSKIYIVKPPKWIISQIVFPANISFLLWKCCISRVEGIKGPSLMNITYLLGFGKDYCSVRPQEIQDGMINC